MGGVGAPGLVMESKYLGVFLLPMKSLVLFTKTTWSKNMKTRGCGGAAALVLACLPACCPVCLLACLPSACLLACLPSVSLLDYMLCLPAFLIDCLSCMLSCLLAYLPACRVCFSLSGCLLDCFPCLPPSLHKCLRSVPACLLAPLLSPVCLPIMPVSLNKSPFRLRLLSSHLLTLSLSHTPSLALVSTNISLLSACLSIFLPTCLPSASLTEYILACPCAVADI